MGSCIIRDRLCVSKSQAVAAAQTLDILHETQKECIIASAWNVEYFKIGLAGAGCQKQKVLSWSVYTGVYNGTLLRNASQNP